MPPFDFQSADIVAFTGNSPTSKRIRFATCSDISHVAGIAKISPQQLRKAARENHLAIPQIDHFQTRLVLFESTTLNDRPCLITGKHISGVQAHDPAQRCREYDGGVRVYRLTPDWKTKFERGTGPEDLGDFLLSRLGRPYDAFEALESGSRVLQYLAVWRWFANLFDCSRENHSQRLFCSEYLASVWRLVNLYPSGSISKVSPAKFIKQLERLEIYETKPEFTLKVA